MSCSRASGSCPNVTVHVQYLLPKNGLCHRSWSVEPPARAGAIIFSTGSAQVRAGLFLLVAVTLFSEASVHTGNAMSSQLPSKSHYQLRKNGNMVPQQNGNKVTGCPVLLNKWRAIRPRAVALGQKVAKKEVQ
jgi:hypothetical protein